MLQWEISAFPGGPLVNLTGTVEEVHEQLIQVNPNYDADYFPEDVDALIKRTDFRGLSYNCDSNVRGYGRKNAIEASVRYLRGVKGQPSKGPGPGEFSLLPNNMIGSI